MDTAPPSRLSLLSNEPIRVSNSPPMVMHTADLPAVIGWWIGVR